MAVIPPEDLPRGINPDELGDDPITRLKNFLDLLTKGALKSYNVVVVVLFTLIFIVLALLAIFNEIFTPSIFK